MIDLHRAGRVGIQRVHRVEAFLMPRQVGLEVGGMGQVQRCAAQVLVDPGDTGAVEGIGEHPDHFLAEPQHDEFAFERLGQGDPVEHRGAAEQGFAVEYLIVKRGAKAGDEGRGLHAGKRLERLQRTFALTFGALARTTQECGGKSWHRFLRCRGDRKPPYC
ncbi:hypothetical protein D3C76_616490 [compost metagenome]